MKKKYLIILIVFISFCIIVLATLLVVLLNQKTPVSPAATDNELIVTTTVTDTPTVTEETLFTNTPVLTTTSFVAPTKTTTPTNTPKPTAKPTQTPVFTPTPILLPDLNFNSSKTYGTMNEAFCDISIYYAFRNSGQSAIPAGKSFNYGVEVKHVPSNTVIYSKTESYSSGMAVGSEYSSYWIHIPFDLSQLGVYRASYWIDNPSVVIESNESNNSYSDDFYVDGLCMIIMPTV